MTAVREYDRGLAQVGPNTFAFLQPNGSWGWSNAGFIAGDGEAMLVDTFFDLATTRELLDGVRTASDHPITTLLNTHHNGDHVWGNQLVEGAAIIAHRNCRDLLLASPPPEFLIGIMQAEDDGGAVSYLKQSFKPFDFSGITVTPPTVVFDDTCSVFVGGVEVQLFHYGPGHTLGDVVAYVPQDKVLYAGDLLFLGSTPLLWEGSLTNWIAAIDTMLALDVQTVVPGHGPVCGPEGLREMQDYLKLVVREGGKLHGQGLTPLDAAARIDLGPFEHWIDRERIAVNCMRLWMEIEGLPAETPLDALEVFGNMAACAKLRDTHAH